MIWKNLSDVYQKFFVLTPTNLDSEILRWTLNPDVFIKSKLIHQGQMIKNDQKHCVFVKFYCFEQKMCPIDKIPLLGHLKNKTIF